MELSLPTEVHVEVNMGSRGTLLALLLQSANDANFLLSKYT